MKKIITLTLSLLFITSFYAQKLDYDHDSKWFFGLNAGGTWQTTDVKNKLYVGYGFVLGRSFNYNYGKKFSFDLRFRYLGGKWYGQDYDTTNVTGNSGYDLAGNVVQKYDTTLGYTINNFQAQVHELGLELVLHANSLRERTGWDPYIFGGVNFVWNQTFGDLYNQDSSVFNNSYYDYSPDGISKSEWKGLSDDIYDSALDGSSQSKYNVNFMPSVGIGLAYQVGPRFSVGIEHKTTFTLKDNFDGYQNATKRWGMFTNDVYHYTSLSLKFNFRSRKVDDAIEEVNNDCLKPAIGIVTPVEKSLTVSSLDFDLEALISQVAGKNNITLSLNGSRDTNFVYSTETSKLKKSFTLIKGQNTIDIVALNGCGTTVERIIVSYEECVPPVVSFLKPSTSQITTSDENYTITAKLEREKTIVYSINGRELRNYNVNEKDSTFSSTITLAEGKNEIKIAVSNECGTDEKTAEVIYVRCDKPIIKVKNGDRAIKIDKSAYTIDALLENVVSKSQISFKLNNAVKSFSYNTSNKELVQKVTLNEGVNIIEITATNDCGDATETITVEYVPCIVPTIAMILPATSLINTEQTSYTVVAKIENITSASQVNVSLNGKDQSIGSYNSVSKTFEKQLNLVSGNNTIILTVSTGCGTVSSNFIIIRTVVDKDMTICFRGQTLIIKESQWSSYQRQGAIQGECTKLVDKDMMICFKGQTLLIKESQWGSYQSQGAIQGECPKPVDKDMTICFKGQTLVIKESQWSSYQRQGAVQGECPKPVDKDMTVCFKGQTLIIKESQWLSYQRQGATQGECPKPVDKDMTICFKGQTLVIKESQWTSYQSQGAVQGDCPKLVDKDMTVCFKGQTLIIKESQWGSYQSQGAIQGECPKPVDKDMTVCFKGQTLIIKESQWLSYQGQGATQGECPKPVDKDMTICFKGQTLVIKESQWVSYQGQGATQGECPKPVDKDMTVCFKGQTLVIKESQWLSYQKQGAVQGECPKPVDKDITICFRRQTITIKESEWASYQSQGAVQGECPKPVDKDMTICFKGQTLIIKESQWLSYQKQGAVQGECPKPVDKDMTICFRRQTITIKESEWVSYQSQGATQGECPEVVDKDMTICFKGQTLVIKESQWASYQSQGATQGECPEVVDKDMTICFRRKTLTIKESQWASYQSQGATQGECPEVEDKKITICHYPPGNTDNPQTIEISQSAWPTHEAHGDTKGECTEVISVGNDEMQICLNGETLIIKKSEWASYKAKGAKTGACN